MQQQQQRQHTPSPAPPSEPDERTRLTAINLALNSKEFQEQIKEWETQRCFLRKFVCEFWKQSQNKFQEYWSTIDEELRTAFVLCALEDLHNTVYHLPEALHSQFIVQIN
jgi:hypothetical protein